MCGIAGVVGFEDRRAAHCAVVRMRRALERRGPNGAGLELWQNAVLGHRRLAIFDLSEAGRQPMVTADRRLGVVFNGAIYNFMDLRRELENLGFKFKSRTDTEVLLHGYRAWGIDGLVERIHGMFAFGLWDEDAQKLFLVRDRLGVKPLFYHVGPDGSLAFASTARALRFGGFADEIDDGAVLEFLEFGFITDARSIYKEVKKVAAATILEWNGANRTCVTREYWHLPTPKDNEAKGISFAEAVKRTEELFLRAVEKRLQADVPVGALLSGGVDSSLVCWAITKLGGDVTAFTVATPNDPSDESADAKATARRLGIKHEILELSPDDSPTVDELTEAFSEPFSAASALGMLRISRAFAESATVMLTGDGGDDVFLGYPEHLNFYAAQRIARHLPSSAPDLWKKMKPLLPRTGIIKRAGSFLDYATGGLGAVACVRDGLPFYEIHGILGERLIGQRLPQRQLPRSLDSARDLLEEFLRYDRRTRFTGEYLTKVDGATMHYAIEARSPFLDHQLWEFASSLPFEIRLHGWTLKAVLRELARRHIDERVARGKKRGFSIPVGRWLVGRWRALMEEVFSDSVLEREGWIRAASVIDQLRRAVKVGLAPNQLWYLLVLEFWLRRERQQDIEHSEVVASETAQSL
ncbi:asparagine synthase (glutamine-hydrolyzing) [Pyrinomonas methylaliphatogenes]|uniref:asparagine synthase (glutamine-hydrolyzing) n=1 Tax=Pyrinomonas methylaliphatogenes TaxID=454194 RepID=A0A0B6WYA8_9BACT|nr:asparagine synthase (glutamine-hydrolyzing) [Pyrinomonas methylaliphatogenes]CDM66253.1 asparagine synthase, glutamine-hydrolyzing [Pyrinomonas methylaliphatogenes]